MDLINKLRAALEAAIAVLDPQIRGLHDLQGVSISPELMAEVNAQVTEREQIRALMQAVLDALDALEGNGGFPELPPATLDPALYEELQGQKSDLGSAIGIFTLSVASNIKIDLGEPTDKPKS